MAELLKGAPVAAAIAERTAGQAEALGKAGIVPTLAIVRVGAREDDLSYERGAVKRCAAVGVETRSVVLPGDVTQDELLKTLEALNRDDGVHGILLFRPLPAQLDDETARKTIAPEKDVDGVTDGSLAGVFTGSGAGFTPCTAQAVMEILSYYGVDLAGKNAVVAGRSLVVGRPLAMLLMAAGATVTLCHSRTRDLPAIAKAADIVVAAIGRMGFFGAEYFAPGQIVADVGIHFDEASGRMRGDVRTEEAEPVVKAITPVPGGVGSVTTAVLVSHVTEAALRQTQAK